MAHEVDIEGLATVKTKYWKCKVWSGAQPEIQGAEPYIIFVTPSMIHLIQSGFNVQAQEFNEGIHTPTGKAVIIQGINYRWSILEVEKRLKDINRIAEIGVSFGENAWRLGHRLKPKELHLIDPYATVPENVITEADKMANDVPFNMAQMLMADLPLKTTFYKEKSGTAFDKFPDEHFDFIFVDGDHSYEGCLEDIEKYYPKVRKGGIIAGDDYHKDGVKPAVDKYFKEYEVSPNGFEWLVEKKG